MNRYISIDQKNCIPIRSTMFIALSQVKDKFDFELVMKINWMSYQACVEFILLIFFEGVTLVPLIIASIAQLQKIVYKMISTEFIG